MMSRAEPRVPRPFLKWAGGKHQLLRELLQRVAAAGGFRRYHEPFLGGGALFFALRRAGLLPRKRSRLSDALPALIGSYMAVRATPETVMAHLQRHHHAHDDAYFYAQRHIYNHAAPHDQAELAALFIYLNKQGVNGLHRVNRRGEFNVPSAGSAKRHLFDPANVLAVSEALRSATLTVGDFEAALNAVEAGDLTYIDPPYGGFTSYTAGGFASQDQVRLARAVRHLHHAGVKVLLSNEPSELVRDLYQGLLIERVHARRAINRNGTARGPVDELLIRNFDDTGALLRV